MVGTWVDCCPELIDLSFMLFKVDRLEERRSNALFNIKASLLKRGTWGKQGRSLD